MARLVALENQFARLLSGKKPGKKAKSPDLQRKDREAAKAWARQCGAEIDIDRSDGLVICVYPPRGVADEADPYAGDHYADGWPGAHAMARAYGYMMIVGDNLAGVGLPAAAIEEVRGLDCTSEAAQARIDELMREFWPERMTPLQKRVARGSL